MSAQLKAMPHLAALLAALAVIGRGLTVGRSGRSLPGRGFALASSHRRRLHDCVHRGLRHGYPVLRRAV